MLKSAKVKESASPWIIATTSDSSGSKKFWNGAGEWVNESCCSEAKKYEKYMDAAEAVKEISNLESLTQIMILEVFNL